MRTKLKTIGTDTRNRYIANVGRMGIMNPYKDELQRTMVLHNVKRADTGEVVADHVWLKVYTTLENLDLRQGDVISLNARVKPYMKGYYLDAPELDYCLSYPSKIVVESRTDRPLKNGEITSATVPTWEELEKARNKARQKVAKTKGNKNG